MNRDYWDDEICNLKDRIEMQDKRIEALEAALLEAKDEATRYDCLVDVLNKRNKELETAICDWCDAIVDMEGVDFVEYVENPVSQNLIMNILDARDALDMEKNNA